MLQKLKNLFIKKQPVVEPAPEPVVEPAPKKKRVKRKKRKGKLAMARKAK